MQHRNSLRQNRRNHRRRILGRISLAGNIRSNNTANGASAEEDARVPGGRVGADEARHGDADDGGGGVEDEDYAALAVAVGEPGCREHPGRGGDVRWEGQDLGHGGAVAHVSGEDDGEEEAEGVGDYIVEQLQPGPFREFPVVEVVQDFAGIEAVNDGISSVAVDARFDDFCFFDCEEGATGD